MPKRSWRYQLRRFLGVLFVFTGIGYVWLAWGRIDGWIALRRLRAYHRRLSGISPARVPRLRFPLSYYRRRLRAGMPMAEVDQGIVDYRKRRRLTEHIGRGTFAIVYEFDFSLTRKHELIALFDDTGLIRLDGTHLTFDIQ